MGTRSARVLLCNLIVRPWERVVPKKKPSWILGWEPAWNQCDKCRSGAANDPGCVVWLDAPVEDYGIRLNAGECLFILKSPPTGEEDIVRPLTCGVAKLLWCDESLSADLENRLREKAKDRKLCEFPDIVREVRVEIWDASDKENKHTGHLHLLWDDPGRRPPVWQDLGEVSASRGPTPRLISAFDQSSY